MRGVLEGSLPDTCVISAESYTDDGGGGGTNAWAVRGTAICRIAPLTGDEREIANRLAEDARWILTLPAETDITTKDRVEVNGGTFNVLAIRAPRSYEVSRRVELGEKV